ncbi:hypothetical protein HNV12_00430 [Methanococcoides sp. SA1]|nr:hypothetical protein [Methanococcoides sp. SA1]
MSNEIFDREVAGSYVYCPLRDDYVPALGSCLRIEECNKKGVGLRSNERMVELEREASVGYKVTGECGDMIFPVMRNGKLDKIEKICCRFRAD